MDMCILDSNACSEPGRFVFDYSYLTLKITGKRDELNEVRAYLKEKFATRLLHDRLFVFCSADHFRSFINDHRESSDKSFIKDMASLFQSKEIILNLPHSGELLFSKPLIMGVINATDDSFFPGSRVLDEQTLESRVSAMIQEGADIIDIGGESSRPGANPIEEHDEINRIVPFVKKIRSFSKIPISVDTYRKSTAEKAIESGADIINDISALRFDKNMADYAAVNAIPVILMHMKGTPGTMQKNPYYSNVITEIKEFFAQRIAFAQDKGIKSNQLVLDPGIGFGKRLQDNLKILNQLESFHFFGLPLLLGTSRKSFIGEVLNQNDPIDRLTGTLGTTALGVQKGVQMFRVHDVQENRNIADLVFNIKKS